MTRLTLMLALVPSLLAAQTADERLRALYTAEWNWRQREMARISDAPGDAGAAAHFPRVDATAQLLRLTYWTHTLLLLDSIPFAQLSPEEQVNAEVLRTTLKAYVNDIRYRTFEALLNSDTFFWTEFMPRQGFANADVHRNYLGRLRDIPRFFDENVANMRAGMARGFTVPRVSAMGRDRTIEPYLAADTTHPLYTPFNSMPATIPAATRDSMRRLLRLHRGLGPLHRVARHGHGNLRDAL